MKIQRAILVMMLGMPAVPLASGAAEQTPRKVTSAFSNPAYSGWCRVTEAVPGDATPAGVCGSVLACLNDSACTKAYCNATEIRGGWKLEKVEGVTGGNRK